MIAYHLGGGVAVGRLLDSDLRLHGTENVFVISSAIMQKAGIANPVLTLLALAHRFAQNQTLGRHMAGNHAGDRVIALKTSGDLK